MKRPLIWLAVAVFISATFSACSSSATRNTTPVAATDSNVISLPEPNLKGGLSLEEVLEQRRSIREYSSEPLNLQEISQILWAAQGITAEWGARTAPSAGALYPLETYLMAGNVENLEPGVYRYSPQEHSLIKIKSGDLRPQLASAALNQSSVKNGAVDLVLSAVYERTTAKYGERGVRYAHMEAGHAAQNVCLEVTALGLGAVTVGAFNDDQVKSLLDMPENETPLYIIPAGRIIK